MEIKQATVALSSAHQYEKKTQRTESLKIWVGDRPNEETLNNASSGSRAPVVISTPSPTPDRSAATTGQSKASHGVRQSDEEILETDPDMLLIRSILERMFGKEWEHLRPLRFNQCDPQDIAQKCAPVSTGNSSPIPTEGGPQREGWGVEYDLQEIEQEMEQTTFSARGVIQTRDGEEIRFELKLDLQREFIQSRNLQMRAGDAVQPIDPLVINFNGQAAELTERNYQFDLNADGENERIASVKAGSAFLVLDKNGDGQVNNGSELFGPQSGNGFAELADYDADKNDWIDANDPVFQQLRLWNPDKTGTTLATLEDKNVGAIYLKNLATPFNYKDGNNESVAELSATSIVVSTENAVGTIQQLNLVG